MSNPKPTLARNFQRTEAKTTNALLASVAPNPFGNSAQFTEVVYADQLNHVSPPSFGVVNFFPPPNVVAANGLTIELWFKAESSGILVGLPMDTAAAAQALAPLLYIDSNGFLRGGLFDSTQITLLSPSQNLIASQTSNGLIVVGPLNALASPLSVVDGQWHHAALVVQPGTSATQSLFLDGRLAATGNANGSFGFSFVASDGTSWQQQTNAPIPFGGSITPQPQTPPASNFLPYAQGFAGCLNELRSWNCPRTVTQIQQLISQPLGPDWSNYQSEGLYGYVGSMQTAVNPGPYQSLTADAPPFDPFTDVDDRLPGYQNYGVFTAIPFTTAALEITFQPSETYSTKITLCQADQIQVSFPAGDANGDNLTGTFSLTVTGATSGELQTITQIVPNSVYTINAPLTDCYRLDFTYDTSVPCPIDNLQFMLIPGPGNTLMQLLLDIVPYQTAYTDPNYPITQTTVDDPRNPGQTVTLPAYWPPFTDETVFPIDPNNFSTDDLLSAYLNLNQSARNLALSGGATFSDFFDLSANNATVYLVTDLSQLLQYAYSQVTGNPPPATVPSAPFDSPVDQVYAFIFNVNSMRQTLSEFLTVYNGWAQTIIGVGNLSLANIPGSIANQIYNAQEEIEVSLKGPSAGDFIGNLLITSALWGLGAVAAPALLPAEAAVAATIAVGFVGSAGANALSQIFSIFLGSSTVKAKLSTVSYTTLEEVSTGVVNDIGSAYKTIIANLLDPAYVQTLYSNYGLLQALNFINAQPLYDDNNTAIQPGENNSLTTGVTYASWQALIPSVFTWSPQLITGDTMLQGSHDVFMSSHMEELSSNAFPAQLGVFEILQGDPDVFYSMVANIQAWQTATKSPTGQFFSLCPIFIKAPSISSHLLTAVWVITWSLIDANKHTMADTLAASLFGIGEANAVLTPVDQNNPLAAAGYGWYFELANAAVTTPFDVFMNWSDGVPSYSPQILAAQLPDGKLYPAIFNESGLGPNPAQFAAAAAADTPPSAIVTLAPSSLDFGAVTISTPGTLSAVLTNNQKDALNSITVTNSYPDVFSVAGVPSEVQPGETANISVTFTPNAAGDQSGQITLSAKGQYGPILLTLAFSGTGFAS